MPSLRAKMKILLILAKTLGKQKLNFRHSTLFHMQTRVSLKYFVNDSLWKSFLDSNLAHTPSYLIFFDNVGNSKAFRTVLTQN